MPPAHSDGRTPLDHADAPAAPTLNVIELGRVEYAESERIQARAVAARKSGAIGDVLLLLEHPPVITLGRNARGENLLASPPALAARGVALVECNRGGDVTFHNPGQLVGYPILDLRRLPRPDFLPSAPRAALGAGLGAVEYMRALEEALIAAAAELGVPARRSPGLTGVWTAPPPGGGAPRKLAAMGVHISRGVSSHGFALNVNNDLEAFRSLLIPCGLAGHEVTSLARELGRPLSVADASRAVVRHFARVFRLAPRGAEPSALP